MAIPASRQEFSEWILRELGSPVIKINIAAEQISDVIDDALQFFGEYHENASERTYLKIPITQTDITNGYINIPENIQSIIRVIGASNSNGSSFMSFSFQMKNAIAWDVFSYGGISSFFIANQYIAEMDNLLGNKMVSRFRQSTGKLHLDFNMEILNVGDFLIVEANAIISPVVYSRLWSNRWLRKLAIAYAKRAWGTNLKKFQNVQLPSGMVLNGQEIYNEAINEIADVEGQIMRHQVPSSFIIA